MSRELETLAAYLPMDRRQAASRGESLPEKTVGAVVFADVSGFTLLTESLERALGSQRGAEELSWQLNRIYSALIAEVHERRGSVIGFSGDAITCWFDDDDGRRATACALDMQRVMAEQQSFATADGTTVRLAIKVAVSQGPVRRLVVGDPQLRVLDLIAGATLERVATAEQLAQQGEVVVDPATATNLGTSLEARAWRHDAQGQRFAVAAALSPSPPRDPWPASSQDTLSDEQIRPFLDPAVYERLRTGQAQFLAETRSMVPLFLSFAGFDFDHDDDVGDKLDRYIRGVQTIIHRFEGSLIDLTVGDKGTYLFAAFGAPIAHEDDAARAVAAALELRSLSLQTTGIEQPRIGLSQGRLHAGPSGSSARRTYTALGDETNVAARLMSQAGAGEILASDRIAKAAASYRFRDLGTLTLKGKRQPLKIQQVTGSKSTAIPEPHHQGSMVGRRPEREHLNGLLQRFISHRDHASVILEGEAGIGKSCLLDHLLGTADNLGFKTFIGTADAVENATPYYAWGPIWRGLFGLDALALDTLALDALALEDLARETLAVETLAVETLAVETLAVETQAVEDELFHVRKRLSLLEDEQAQQLAPLLNSILSIDFIPSLLTAQLHGEPRAESTRKLLISLMRSFALEQPLLLVVEDTHWLDSASWYLIDAIARESIPVVLILTTRPSTPTTHTTRRRLLDYPTTSLMALEPLGHDEVLELVSRRLGVAALPEPLAALLREKTEGNPFFSEELAYALRDAGLIQITEGRCQLAPGVDDLRTLDFPQTIEGVVTSRLDRLSAAEQLTVKVASVVGRVFAHALLRDIYPVPTDRGQLGSHLANLARLDIAQLLHPEPALAYTFKHIITQEVAYNRMLLVQRRQLHQAVALWYEARADEPTTNDSQGNSSRANDSRTMAIRYGSPTSLSPLLAHHWSHAIEGVSQPSPEQLCKAISYLETAGKDAVRNHASREAIGYLTKTLKFDDLLRQSSAGRPMAANAQRRSRWHAWMGQSYIALGELTKSHPHYLEALTLLGQPTPRRRRHLLFSTGREATTQTLLHLCPPWLRPVGLRPAESPTARETLLAAARIYNYLAEIHFFANDQLSFLFHALRFANLSARVGPSAELAESCAGMSVLTIVRPLRFVGEFYFRKVEEIDPVLVPPDVRIRVLIFTALAEYCLGRWSQVREKSSEAIEICERLGDRHHWGELVSMLGSCTMLEGDFERSEQLLQALTTAGRARSHSQQLVWALSSLAALALRRGRPQEAAAMIEDALPSLDLDADRMYGIVCYGLLAMARLHLGDDGAARTAANQASEQIARTPRATAPLVLGGYASTAEARCILWRQAIAAGAPAPELEKLANAAHQAYRSVRALGRMYTVCQPDAWRCAGLFAEASGRRRRALRAWRKSLATAEKLAMPYEQARAHFELGRCLAPTDPTRSHHLDQADQILRRLGGDEAALPMNTARPTPVNLST